MTESSDNLEKIRNRLRRRDEPDQKPVDYKSKYESLKTEILIHLGREALKASNPDLFKKLT